MMRGRVFRVFTLSLIISITLSATAISLKERYPNYKVIFNKFDIPLSYIDDPSFVKFVNDNEDKFANFYRNSVVRGKNYIPLFKDLLRSHGLSDLFIYMSMTESGFQTYAKSSKNAVGLWQFMAATAKRFNLEVSKTKDERYDPIASTEAASRYIRSLYAMFGKWYLVMMAYNCGEGRLQRAIQRVGTDDFFRLMSDEYPIIPAETRRYIKKILLLSMMGENIRVSNNREAKVIKEKIIPKGEVYVNIYGGITLDMVAMLIGEKPEVLYRLNPQIKGGIIPPDVSVTQIVIPAKKLSTFRKYYKPPTLQELFKLRGYKRLIAHIVKRGDTLKKISKMYKVTELDIIIANELKSEKLKVGTVLMIPMTEENYNKRLDRLFLK